MNSTLTHKGLTARVEFDADDGIFWGKVLGLPDQISITFEGQTVAELRQDFCHAVDFYLEECARKGVAPPQTRQRQTDVARFPRSTQRRADSCTRRWHQPEPMGRARARRSRWHGPSPSRLLPHRHRF